MYIKSISARKIIARSRLTAAVCTFLIVFASHGLQAAVVVNNDEWTLSNTGFANAPVDTERFVTNLASFFSPSCAASYSQHTDVS